jgi:hypothetical protein
MTEADAREAVRLASSVREAAVRLMHPYIAGEVT